MPKYIIDTDSLTISILGSSEVLPVEPALTYPREIVAAGCRVMAKAPLNPNWETTQAGHVFFKVGGPYVMADPSNGDDGVPPQPLRTPHNWPLRYTFDMAGKMIGTPTVTTGGAAFNNDEECDAYIADVKAKRAAQEAAQEAAGGAVWLPTPHATPEPAGGDIPIEQA